MARLSEWLEMRRIAGEDANGQRWDKWPQKCDGEKGGMASQAVNG